MIDAARAIRAVRRVTALCLAGLLVAACGPVEYINQVTRRASAEVAAAKAAGADRYALYEYTMAIEFLHKAREEAGYAAFQAAIRFGKKAEEMARKGRRIALDKAKSQPIEPGEEPPPAVPGGSG